MISCLINADVVVFVRVWMADIPEITPLSLLLFKLIITVKLFPPTRALINTHVQTMSGRTN